MNVLRILKNNHLKQLELYLQEHNANEEIRGQSLLCWAVFLGHLEAARLLIKQGADVNKKDELERTPLSIAAFFGFTDISKLLLEHHAEISGAEMERAYYGFDEHIQINILNLFREYGWINLYLDDLRNIPQGFVGVKTVEEAINFIQNSQVHILSLDHDLGMDEQGELQKTGYDLVKYFCEHGIRPANKIYLHADNVVGKENMYQTLLAAQRRGFIDDDIEIYPYPFVKNRYSCDQ